MSDPAKIFEETVAQRLYGISHRELLLTAFRPEFAALTQAKEKTDHE